MVEEKAQLEAENIRLSKVARADFHLTKQELDDMKKDIEKIHALDMQRKQMEPDKEIVTLVEKHNRKNTDIHRGELFKR